MTVKSVAELHAEIADNFRTAHTYPDSLATRLTQFLTNVVDSVDATYSPVSIASLIVSGEGAPEDGVQATLSCNPAGDDNALTFTAVAYGADGNSITIEYVDPAANDAELSVSVTDTAITVNLATDEAGLITSTAADVLAAIEAAPAADALVTVVIDASDTGAGDDGSGVVTALASAPMTGGEGTSIDVSPPGGLYIDTTNAVVYRNDGTAAAPVWVALADA